MFTEKRKFKNSKGLTLSAIYEGEDKKTPVIVMCHGYGSSKNSESNADLAKKLVEAGLCVFRFDFAGCGESEGSIDDLIPSNGIDDLKSAIKNLGRKDFRLHGTSFGGYVALLYASENPLLALTLKAPVSYYPELLRKPPEDMPSRQKLYHETKNLDLYEKTKNIKCPTLIVHGSEDEIVPIHQSRKLLTSLTCDKRLHIIEGANHDMRGTFMEEAHTEIANFLRETLLN